MVGGKIQRKIVCWIKAASRIKTSTMYTGERRKIVNLIVHFTTFIYISVHKATKAGSGLFLVAGYFFFHE